MIEKIINDPFILDYYDRIKKYEDEHNAYAYHGINHAMNVMKIAESILIELGYDETIIIDTKVAALLHDLGCYIGKDEHEIRSYNIAKQYIENNDIVLNDKTSVLNAIKNHRNNFSSDNIITRVLIFADKLDIKKDRVASGGFNEIGMRQLQYIKDIKISVIDNKIIIKFIIGIEANIEELKSFYFMKKVYKSIETFAKYNNMKYCIKINNETWDWGEDNE